MGSVEHAFGKGSARTHELNFVFRVDGRSVPWDVASREPKLTFMWHPLGKLAAANLQPSSLQRLLPQLAKRKRAAWSSTME